MEAVGEMGRGEGAVPLKAHNETLDFTTEAQRPSLKKLWFFV